MGPANCAGIQTCLDDGRGFGACACGIGGLGGFSAAGGSSGAAGGAFGGGPIDGGALDGPTACEGISLQPGFVERDIFLLLDQSGSMVDNGSNRWTFVTNAIIDAVLSPPLMGVGLGLGYFGLHPPGSPPADPAAPGSAGLAHYPSIPTYVIAIGGVQGLDQIAQAGGTSQAFTVDDTNTRQQFLDALKQISGRIVTCEFTLPRYEERPIDFSKVNVHHRPVGGSERVVYYVDGPADCSAATGGWYYERDGNGNPVAIKLCPTSCNAVMSGGTLTIVFGCTSVRPPLQ